MRSVRATRTGPAVGAAILLLSVGVLAAGCSGGAGQGGEAKDGGSTGPGPAKAAQPPPLPPGYVPAAAGRVTVAHPPSWRAVTAPKGWAVSTELRRRNFTVARLGVITDVPQSDDPTVVSAASFTGILIQAKVEQQQPNRPLQVAGARKAVRTDYTYVDNLTGNLGRGTDVNVVYDKKKAVTVRITGLRNLLSLNLIDQIVRTIAVKPPS